MKVAAADGVVDPEEVEVIRAYFVEDWGYAPEYVEAALEVVGSELEEVGLEELTVGLRTFTRESPDCDHRKVRKKVVALLKEVAEADGEVHEVEALMLGRVSEVLLRDPWELPGVLRRGR